jgi:hypothetical protein
MALLLPGAHPVYAAAGHQLKAEIPVSVCPSTSWWISEVPS